MICFSTALKDEVLCAQQCAGENTYHFPLPRENMLSSTTANKQRNNKNTLVLINIMQNALLTASSVTASLLKAFDTVQRTKRKADFHVTGIKTIIIVFHNM